MNDGSIKMEILSLDFSITWSFLLYMTMCIDIAIQIKGNDFEHMMQKCLYFFYYISREFATMNNRKTIYDFARKACNAYSEEKSVNQHE